MSDEQKMLKKELKKNFGKTKKLQRLYSAFWVLIAIGGLLLPSLQYTAFSQSIVAVFLPYLLGAFLAQKAARIELPRRIPMVMSLAVVGSSLWCGEGCGVLLRTHVMPLMEPYALLRPLANLAPLSEVMGCVFLTSIFCGLLANRMNQHLAKLEFEQFMELNAQKFSRFDSVTTGDEPKKDRQQDRQKTSHDET